MPALLCRDPEEQYIAALTEGYEVDVWEYRAGLPPAFTLDEVRMIYEALPKGDVELSRQITTVDFPLSLYSHTDSATKERYLRVYAADAERLTRAQVERLVLVLNEWLAEVMR